MSSCEHQLRSKIKLEKNPDVTNCHPGYGNQPTMEGGTSLLWTPKLSKASSWIRDQARLWQLMTKLHEVAPCSSEISERFCNLHIWWQTPNPTPLLLRGPLQGCKQFKPQLPLLSISRDSDKIAWTRTATPTSSNNIAPWCHSCEIWAIPNFLQHSTLTFMWNLSDSTTWQTPNPTPLLLCGPLKGTETIPHPAALAFNTHT